MKKILFLIAFLVPFAAQADERQSDASLTMAMAAEILEKVGARVTAMGEYHAEFEAMAEGNRIVGVYAVSGEKYYMRADGYEIIGDGRTRWEINHDDEEVLIDIADPADNNILTNPTRAFDFADTVFRSSYKGEVRVDGEIFDVVELTPRDTRSQLQRITLTVSRRTGLPVELRYMADGLSEEIVVRIVRMTQGLLPDARFTFDSARYRGYDITDFR
ncbi:MAG: outer membrane lipoprotein carrier protein LolA [Rikenellaceae bacterium]|nr:outer membrane lipoprotein carrier protein LolA [Rikenellaceae bacterium]MCL2692030.1 outer membrane lipoprotein carrier protein LolA [Rikenellaceae bacterium]